MYTQKQAFDKVEEIINDIIEGRRLHVQETFHAATNCGTAHCIAGWMIVDTSKMLNINHEVYDAIGETPCIFSKRSINGLRYMDTELIEENYVIEEFIRRNPNLDEETFTEKMEEMIDYGESSEWVFGAVCMGIDYEESETIFGPTLTIEEIKDNFYKLKKLYKV